MIETEQQYVEVTPGDQIINQMKIWNTGNGLDTFTFDILNLKELTKAGWTVQLTVTKIDVDSKDQKLIKVTATTPQDWTVWTNEISTVEIKVTSENSERSAIIVTEQYTFYTRQKGVYIPGFDPTITILALAGLAAVGMKKKDEE